MKEYSLKIKLTEDQLDAILNHPEVIEDGLRYNIYQQVVDQIKEEADKFINILKNHKNETLTEHLLEKIKGEIL